MEELSNKLKEEKDLNFNSLLSIEPFYNIDQSTGKAVNFKKYEAKSSLNKFINEFCKEFHKSRQEIITKIKTIVKTKRELDEKKNF